MINAQRLREIERQGVDGVWTACADAAEQLERLLTLLGHIHHTLVVHGHMDRGTDLHSRIVAELVDPSDYRVDSTNWPENMR